jgi:hypothetical protein
VALQMPEGLLMYACVLADILERCVALSSFALVLALVPCLALPCLVLWPFALLLRRSSRVETN